MSGTPFHPKRILLPLAAAAALAPALALADIQSCKLNSAHGEIKHVIYLQFDNTHFRRDIPSVPSDLEQMPHLLDFLRDNGTLLANDHTILISHTAGGILSTLTGVYPDRTGQGVSNSYVRTSSTGAFTFPSSFGYWTDPVSAANTPTVQNMIGPDGKTTPAPWVVYTRAGCDVGGVASANMVLENVSTLPTGDITKVFGNPSPQQAEADAARLLPSTPANAAAKNKPQTDFVGLAVHCAQGSSVCASGQPDLLPDEAGGYTGFKGLFGAQAINPFLAEGPVVNDLSGNPIADPFGQPGFPGFDGMEATATLAYVAAMHEKGIPVTFAYISDAHDFHGVAGNQHAAFGPGDAGYVAQLKAYDQAFDQFFQRLAKAGITKANTLFIVTVDEGDHFTGVRKTGCDGVNIPCVYGPNEVGEINANIDALVANQFPSLAAQFLGASALNAFTVHGDSAPTFYLAKKGTGGGALAQTDPLTREFERSIVVLTAVNPYTGVSDTLAARMADQTAMTSLHMMVAADPARNPVFVLFADPDYFITDFPASTCLTCINPPFAWNHGDVQKEIATTWIGMVGPGVRRDGVKFDIWTDHTDVRPTILSLAGLKDSYVHDGRTITEILHDSALPRSLREHQDKLERLGAVYKQVNAPFGQFNQQILAAATKALKSGSAADDRVYTEIQAEIKDLTAQRDALASQMKTVIDAAAFGGKALDERDAARLSDKGEDLIERARFMADRDRRHERQNAPEGHEHEYFDHD